MTGPQTEIEIRLWRDEFARMRQTPEWTDVAMDAADDLLHRYRARYGQSAIVWYDEPTFIEDGVVQPCWMQGEDHPVLVTRACDRWEYRAIKDPRWKPLAGRRVCPITKPPEPNQ